MRKISLGMVGALCATLMPLGAPRSPVAQAAPNDIIAIVIDGTGFGHGRGMSQWGAYGYAVDHGWQWQDILDQYYGGTEAGTVAADQRVRVRLTPYDGLGTVGVISHGPGVQWNGSAPYMSMYATETSSGVFDIYGSHATSCPGAATLTVPDGPLSIAPTTLVPAARDMQKFLYIYHDNTIVVDGYFGTQTQQSLKSWQAAQPLPNDGIWDLDDATRARAIIAADSGAAFTLLGTETTSTGDPVTFTSPNGENSAVGAGLVLGVCRSDRTVTHYRGSIDVLSTASGNRVVNDVTAEDYLRGVVPKEISANWANAAGGAGANAVRAQAVAARSYGLQENRSYDYDNSTVRYATTCDTTSCQVYGGSAKRPNAEGPSTPVENPLTDAAIVATARVVRRWPAGHPSAGQLVRTEFSASNGPRTAGGAFPPIDDIGDDTLNNPNHTWTRVIDADTLESKYGLGQMTSASMTDAAESQYRVYDGIWFDDIVLSGTTGTKRMQAWDFRNAFSLPSPGFTVRTIRQDTTTSSFGFIGDSVGNSIAQGGVSEFDRLIDGTFASATIHVEDGRCTARSTCPGKSGVEVANSLPTGLDLVVVELGYNDFASTFASDVDAMMTALTARGVRNVMWVNMADIRPKPIGGAYAPFNAALAAAAVKWPILTVLDWNAASSSPQARARWFTDGVHLSITGQAEFALWLRSKLLTSAPSHWLVPPKKIQLPIVGESMTGIDGQPVVVPPNATAVALNVTAYLPVGSGYVTVWPCSSIQPTTSNLNYAHNDVIANNVIAPIADDGTICLYSRMGTHLIVDVGGWFTGESSPTNGAMVGVTPQRIVDTRDGTGWPTRLSPNTPLVLDIPGFTATLPNGSTVTAPVGAKSVSLNVTAVFPVAAGYLTVWPCAAKRPLAASVNFAPGSTVGNGVLAGVDGNGQVCIYSSQTTDVVVDVQGWFGAANAIENATGGSVFTAATPKRLVDTRVGTGAPKARVASAKSLVIPIHGTTLDVDGTETIIPTSATAAVINIVSFLPDTHGYLTVWPCQGDTPLAANLVYAPGDVIANGVVAPIGADGAICLFTHSRSDVIVDISGWLVNGSDGGFEGVVPKRFVDTRYSTGPVPL